MLVIYWSTVGDIMVNCRWYIGQLLVAYQSCVNSAGESKREQVSDRPAHTLCTDSLYGFGSFSRFVVSFVSFDVQNGIVCLSVNQLLTNTLVKYRPTIGEVSAKCWRGIVKVSVN